MRYYKYAEQSVLYDLYARWEAIPSIYGNTIVGALRAIDAATSLPGADAAPVRGNMPGHTWGSDRFFGPYCDINGGRGSQYWDWWEDECNEYEQRLKLEDKLNRDAWILHEHNRERAEFLSLSGTSYFLAKAQTQAKAEREAVAAAAAKAAGDKPANSIQNNGLTFEWVDFNNLHQQIEGHPYKMGIYAAGAIVAVALIVSLFTCCCCGKGCSTMGNCFAALFKCLRKVCKGEKKGKGQGGGDLELLKLLVNAQLPQLFQGQVPPLPLPAPPAPPPNPLPPSAAGAAKMVHQALVHTAPRLACERFADGL